MASTYPLELIQLQQWLHKTGQYLNEKAKAEAVKQEVQKKLDKALAKMFKNFPPTPGKK